MIVLDEQLFGLGIEDAVTRWYTGAVYLIRELRPGTIIKDDAIPMLLAHVSMPTFVTINERDFKRADISISTAVSIEHYRPREGATD